MKTFVAALLLALLGFWCSERWQAERRMETKLQGHSDSKEFDNKITLFALNGGVVKTWISFGGVRYKDGGGVIFTDKETKCAVYVTGTLVVETVEVKE